MRNHFKPVPYDDENDEPSANYGIYFDSGEAYDWIVDHCCLTREQAEKVCGVLNERFQGLSDLPGERAYRYAEALCRQYDDEMKTSPDDDRLLVPKSHAKFEQWDLGGRNLVMGYVDDFGNSFVWYPANFENGQPTFAIFSDWDEEWTNPILWIEGVDFDAATRLAAGVRKSNKAPAKPKIGQRFVAVQKFGQYIEAGDTILVRGYARGLMLYRIEGNQTGGELDCRIHVSYLPHFLASLELSTAINNGSNK